MDITHTHTHTLTHSLTHLLTYSHTHSLTHTHTDVPMMKPLRLPTASATGPQKMLPISIPANTLHTHTHTCEYVHKLLSKQP